MSKETKPSYLRADFYCVITALIIIAWPSPAPALEEINKTFLGVAIKGYDTVAYFTEGRAVKGQRKYAHVWNDAKWYFANDSHRELFVRDPEKYAPQYGGY